MEIILCLKTVKQLTIVCQDGLGMAPCPESPVSSVPPRRLLGNGSFPASSFVLLAEFLRAGAEIGHYTNNAGFNKNLLCTHLYLDLITLN